MNLREFVAEVLTEIVSGVSDAQASLDDTDATVGPRISISERRGLPVTKGDLSPQRVEFDVAVTVATAKQGEVKAGLTVASMLGAGGRSSTDNSESTVSRIRFDVPLYLPRQGSD